MEIWKMDPELGEPPGSVPMVDDLSDGLGKTIGWSSWVPCPFGCGSCGKSKESKPGSFPFSLSGPWPSF